MSAVAEPYGVGIPAADTCDPKRILAMAARSGGARWVRTTSSASGMKYVLLLGAGFSHNWGGWLSSEVFEYLLGAPAIVGSLRLRNLLWAAKERGDEGALGDLQSEYDENRSDDASKC